jgi:putative transcriptional regulator
MEKNIELQKLKAERLKLNYNYQQIADLAHISKTYYWQIEHCKRNLTYHLAKQIAKVFNLKPDDLFYNEVK